MQINPILRISFLSSIVIIGFFSVVLLVNSLSSLNKMANDVQLSIAKEQMQNVNYRSDIERKIDTEVRENETLGDMERVNINNTIKANSEELADSVADSQKPSGNQNVLVGY